LIVRVAHTTSKKPRYIGIFSKDLTSSFLGRDFFSIDAQHNNIIRRITVFHAKHLSIPRSGDFLHPYLKYVQDIGIQSLIYQKYLPFLHLRQSEIKNNSDIVSAVAPFDQKWLIKAAYRAFNYIRIVRPNVILGVPDDVLIGLHVLMLDNMWFDNFVKKHKLDNNFGFSDISFHLKKKSMMTVLYLKVYGEDLDIPVHLLESPVPLESELHKFMPPSIIGKEIEFLINIFFHLESCCTKSC